MPFLQWVNDDEARRATKSVPFRLLKEEAVYGDATKAKDNLLIQGDNLDTLRALLPFYRGKVKCIYIDPPYNTGNAFEHYDDNLEHSQWLTLMLPRLQLLREFLRDDGAFWVQIDDDEQAYLKVLLDEVFGRENFVTTICTKMSHLSGLKMSHKDKKIPKIKEFILLYAKKKDYFKLNPIYVPAEWDEVFDRYNSFLVKDSLNPEDISLWKVVPLKEAARKADVNIKDKEDYTKFRLKHADLIFRTARNGSEAFSNIPNDDKFRKIETARGDVKFSYKREEVLFCADKLKEINGEKLPVQILGDIWTDIGINNLHNEGGVEFKNAKKPEKLVERLLQYCTVEGDIVLDSFLGSGTTAAVAHKMKRRFIGIELGAQARTHCIPRLQKVIDGEQGGISKALNWQGGGGFMFYTLDEPVFDEFGLINPKVDFRTLAAYLWQRETKEPSLPDYSPYLGSYQGTGYYLLFNGVLSEENYVEPNVLTYSVLKSLLEKYPFNGPKVIYADACVGISEHELKSMQVIFKQIPYDIMQ